MANATIPAAKIAALFMVHSLDGLASTSFSKTYHISEKMVAGATLREIKFPQSESWPAWE
jgi:hypothetical protein